MLNGNKPAQVSPLAGRHEWFVVAGSDLLFEPAKIDRLAVNLVDHRHRHLDRAHRIDVPAGMFQRHAMAIRNVKRRVAERGAYRVVDRQGRIHLRRGRRRGCQRGRQRRYGPVTVQTLGFQPRQRCMAAFRKSLEVVIEVIGHLAVDDADSSSPPRYRRCPAARLSVVPTQRQAQPLPSAELSARGRRRGGRPRHVVGIGAAEAEHLANALVLCLAFGRRGLERAKACSSEATPARAPAPRRGTPGLRARFRRTTRRNASHARTSAKPNARATARWSASKRQSAPAVPFAPRRARVRQRTPPAGWRPEISSLNPPG